MTRLKLPQGLPQRTDALRVFESQLTGLNDIYWLLRAANQDFTARGNADARLSSYVQAPVLAKLDITKRELSDVVSDVEMKMRHMMLVSAVSYHEDYIATALESVFERPSYNSGLSSIKIRLADISPDGLTKAEIEKKVIQSKIDDIIKSRYSERMKYIINVISKATGNDIRTMWTDDQLGSAPFEARNCVIHCAGFADARAVSELGWLYPGLREGDLLPLNEESLWRMFGALRDMARIIDLGIRS